MKMDLLTASLVKRISLLQRKSTWKNLFNLKIGQINWRRLKMNILSPALKKEVFINKLLSIIRLRFLIILMVMLTTTPITNQTSCQDTKSENYQRILPALAPLEVACLDSNCTLVVKDSLSVRAKLMQCQCSPLGSRSIEPSTQ